MEMSNAPTSGYENERSELSPSQNNSPSNIGIQGSFGGGSIEVVSKQGNESQVFGENAAAASSHFSSNHPDVGLANVAPATSENSNDDYATLSRQHFTRSKNNSKSIIGNTGGGKNGNYHLEGTVGGDDAVDEAAIIAACSLVLAKLNDWAYQCALVSDANQILERITLPMSFPWHHPILPVVRNIPRDIDEMPAILCMEDEGLSAFDNGPLGYGGFETGKRRRTSSGKEGIRIASRRAEDVGVIELTMLKLPHISQPPFLRDFSAEPEGGAITSGRASLLNDFWKHGPGSETLRGRNSSSRKQSWDDDESIEGAWSLKSFTVAQGRKRRKVDDAMANTQRIFVSVKVGNASSRSSLFAPFATTSVPLLREAVFPLEVQNGRAVTAANAKKLVDEIGTFDCRYGAPRTMSNAKFSNRVFAGRTRLMWTYNGSSEHNKVVFSSTLKREKLEPGSQKRPTNVRLGVRLNGALLSIESGLSDPTSIIQSSEIPYSSKAVDAAINVACALPVSKPAKPQCLVDTGKFFHAVRVARAETSGITSAELAFGVSLARPAIDCLPLDDGVIVATCGVPGKIQPGCVQECLNNAAHRNGIVCTVCWTGSQPHYAVEECIGCGLTAHLACCFDRGERLAPQATKADNASKTWKCAACSAGMCPMSNVPTSGQNLTEKRTKRVTKVPAWLENDQVALPFSSRQTQVASPCDEPTRCACCPHSGGAMSATTDSNGGKVWLHEVCRIWQQPVVSEPVTCALCGVSNGITTDVVGKKGTTTPQIRLGPDFTTKCAASGCLVRFHPMCALLVSKLAEEEENRSTSVGEQSSGHLRLDHEKNKDIRLTNKYTLTFAQISHKLYSEYTRSGIGQMQSRQNHSNLLPLAFCGIHNPDRDPTLYGCYPGGCHFEVTNLRIPPKRKRISR